MKKIVTILLGILLCFACFVGCGESENGGNQGETPGGNQEVPGGSQGELPGGSQGEEPGEEPGDDEPSEPEWKKDGKMKILFVGNSFADDTREYAWDIAKSLGFEEDLLIGSLFVGGCTVEMHLRYLEGDLPAYTYFRNDSGRWLSTPDYRLSDAVLEESMKEGEDGWDVLILSTGTGDGGSMCDPTSTSYAKLQQYLDRITELAPDAKLYWNMTWAGTEGYNHRDMTQGQMSMYERHVETVKSTVLTKPEITGVIATGTAIQNARTSFMGDTLNRDGWHLSFGTGRYIAGLTFIGTVLGLELKDNVYKPASVSEDEQLVAIESARNAVKTPFAVTESEYKD